MDYSFNTGLTISPELHKLALDEYKYVINEPKLASMNYQNEAARILLRLYADREYGGHEILRSYLDNPICNLEGFNTRPEFEQAVLEHLPIIKLIGKKFWIRIQRVSGGVWFPYHSDEVKTGGIFVGLKHHGEVTKFWKEVNPTPFYEKARSNLSFEQEICVKDREVWLFDHQAVHSVHNCNATEPRLTMTISFDGLRPTDLLPYFKNVT